VGPDPLDGGQIRLEVGRIWSVSVNPQCGGPDPVAAFISMAACSSASTTATSWRRGPDLLGGGPDLVDA
jgi:hypothetical protein